MANWFPFNYRDVKAWHAENLPLTTTSDEAAKFLDAAIAQMVLIDMDPHIGGVEEALEKAKVADPDFFMANLIGVAMKAMACNTLTDDKLEPAFNDLKEKAKLSKVSQWELLHLSAVEALIKNNLLKACQCWEDILVDHPRDMLALHWIFFHHLTTGRKRFLRDNVNRVVNNYRPSDRYYGNIHGKLCFGYEENEQYEKAKIEGDIALGATPKDVWAIHSVAHIFDETARPSEGVRFLEELEPNWSANHMFSVHVSWHKSLYMMSLGEFENALTLFDDVVKPKAINARFHFPLSDATSLLLRLEMENCPNPNGKGVLLYQDRWRELAEAYSEPAKESINNVFYDYHALITYLLGDQRGMGTKIRDDIIDQASRMNNSDPSYNCMVSNRVGSTLAKATIAFADQEYNTTIKLLAPVRFEVQELLGGSHAQKDIIDLMLLRSAIWSGQTNLAQQLLSERIARSPSLDGKPLGVNERLQQVIMSTH